GRHRQPRLARAGGDVEHHVRGAGPEQADDLAAHGPQEEHIDFVPFSPAGREPVPGCFLGVANLFERWIHVFLKKYYFFTGTERFTVTSSPTIFPRLKSCLFTTKVPLNTLPSKVNGIVYGLVTPFIVRSPAAA